ncbi:MAG: DNA-protecting protein DprA [Hyphomicrobiales bacterium]|nr:DNA-protecting protein DprA [Hyphomicrobiales bacterium]
MLVGHPKLQAERERHALSDEERLDWLRLIRSDNIGPRTFRALLAHCGSARAALAALPDLARRGGAARALRIYSRADAERELAAARAKGVAMVASVEPHYPSRLRMIDDAPPLLAVQGQLSVLARSIIGIVGARNASAAGLRFTERIARELGEAGFVTASGLARGVDGAAHKASLPTGTVAAIAGGHDCIYPPEHLGLAEAIAAHGALISEMPLGFEPRARDFPRRNRLISGLAVGIVVVEAAQRSGSLITARMALEQGREVFAVPGSPLDPRAAGTNGLLKQGATIVTEATDVISVVAPILGEPVCAQTRRVAVEEAANEVLSSPDVAADARHHILALLGPTPVPLDDLVRRAGCTPSLARIVLLELELAGRLEHSGGSIALRPPY